MFKKQIFFHLYFNNSDLWNSAEVLAGVAPEGPVGPGPLRGLGLDLLQPAPRLQGRALSLRRVFPRAGGL